MKLEPESKAREDTMTAYQLARSEFDEAEKAEYDARRSETSARNRRNEAARKLNTARDALLKLMPEVAV